MFLYRVWVTHQWDQILLVLGESRLKVTNVVGTQLQGVFGRSQFVLYSSLMPINYSSDASLRFHWSTLENFWYIYYVDPGVDGVKRLRLTPKLFDWLVDASHFFRRRRRGSFSTAITTRLVWKISRVVATSVYVCGLSHTGMIMSTATAHESVTSSNIWTSETTRNTCLLSTAGHFTADIPAPDRRLQID